MRQPTRLIDRYLSRFAAEAVDTPSFHQFKIPSIESHNFYDPPVDDVCLGDCFAPQNGVVSGKVEALQAISTRNCVCQVVNMTHTDDGTHVTIGGPSPAAAVDGTYSF